MIAVIGGLLRLVNIGGPSLWYDEISAVRMSNSSLSSIIPETLAGRHPPLYHLILHFWDLLGSGDSWVRLVSAACGIAAIVLVYFIGREMFSRRVGLWSAALTAVSPFLIWYSRDATDYSMAIATTLVSLLFLITATRKGGWHNWTFFVLASTAAMFTHYYNLMFLVAEVPLFLLMVRPKGSFRPWLICQGLLGLILVPWIIMLNQTQEYISGGSSGIQIPHFGQVLRAIGTAPVMFFEGYARLDLGWERDLLLGFEDKIIFLTGLIFFLALAYMVFRRTTRQYQKNFLALAVFSFLTIALPVLTHLAQGALIAGRYYAIAAPIFFLLIAASINVLPNRMVWLSGGAIVVVMLFLSGMQLQDSYKDDWRQVMSTIADDYRPGDEILCFPVHQCFTAKYYYLSGAGYDIPIRGGFIPTGEQDSVYLSPRGYVWNGYHSNIDPTEPITDKVQLRRQTTLLVSEADRLWLISGTGLLGHYPDAEFVEKALASDWRLEREWIFLPLVMKLYVRKATSPNL